MSKFSRPVIALLSTLALGASLMLAPSAAEAAASATCKSGQLPTLAKGVLTIATDDPAYSPWFDSNTPSNGKGYEAAVAYAVAQKLGYGTKRVKWVKASFDSVIQPGAKNYDFDINEVSITPERAKAVDFSSGYYDVAQALVTVKGSGVEKVKKIADLANAKLGAAVGTTSYSTITDLVKPKATPAVYDTNDLAVAALKSGAIKGLVLDLPTAFYIAATVDGAQLVGQFSAAAGGEKFGLVLNKGSKLTSCVSAAVDALRANGRLKSIEKKWLAQSGGAPLIKP
jgi:polar amino acid transport system substrate-binding protein